ncbi:MAG TPA: hypothetical protein VJ810_08955 [Blastocatellia bacterium]|nr:hypothetical protein [Blastocatellia bacterium]
MIFHKSRSGRLLTAVTVIVSLSVLVIAQSRAPRKISLVRLSAKPAVTPLPTRPGSVTRAQQSQPGQLLPLRRVILYSNGVAYFERRGTVTGRADINLSFKQSQVDDVLKSLLVLDLGRGRVGAVSYNSSSTPSARLNEIPFSIEASTNGDAAGGLAGVLEQLQGARVAVTAAANRNVTGAILTIGERQVSTEKDKAAVKTHTLVIATDSGELQSFDLQEVRAIKLLDEGARRDITQFANVSASARRRDAKTITVTSEGEGQREMIVSYTIAAPIWKTTYRVVLDPEGSPFFQGWAVVDNISEEDWEDVSLSLVSGAPVSFIQPIQNPLYRHRPIIPIPQDLSLKPQAYEAGEIGAGIGGGSGSGYGTGSGGGAGGGQAVIGGGRAVAPPLSGPQQMRQQGQFNVTENVTGFSRPTTSVSNAITSGESGVETAATGGEVGELFEYRVEQPVTVRRDRSALIPILQTKMDGERVSVYNEAARRDRPMHGIRLKNTSALTLEGGSLTVIDGDAYAGEALIERLKSKEQRFISFGLDLGTLVTTKFKGERKPVFLVRAQKGVFEAHYHQTQKKTYTIINQTDKKRIVYVEHPSREGWKLSDDTQKPASQTINFYRFRVELEPRATFELPVTENQALMDSYQLTNITPRDVELFVTSNYIDAKTRAELEKLIEMKLKIGKEQMRINDLDKEAEEIGDDQKRLRENIATLKNTNEAKQLVTRYIAKAGEQETRLEQIAKEKREAQGAQAKLMAEFEAAAQALTINPIL